MAEKEKSKDFIPVKLSGPSDEIWFETADDAWEYIYSRSCDSCKEGRRIWDACSAEWTVFTRKQWEK